MRRFGLVFGREMVLGSLVGSAVLLASVSGCRTNERGGLVAVDSNGPDPADANMASVPEYGDGEQSPANALYVPGQGSQGSRRLLESPSGRVFESPSGRVLASPSGRVLGARMSNVSQERTEVYAQNGAPIERRVPQGVPAPEPVRANESQSYGVQSGAPNQSYPGQGQPDQSGPVQGYPDRGYSDQGYPDQGDPAWSDGEQGAYNQVTEEAEDAPPPLPVYDQPPAPAPNYLWTPGYWNYGPGGYYWVPGAWVAAPFAGALWTPGYWGVWHRHYGFHPAFWGRHVGFYGGVAYGCGYYGSGYHGGYWRGNDFFYNEAVNRVNVNNVRNVYNRTVVVNNTVINNTFGNTRNVAINRVSYNGPGGIQARPVAAEIVAFHSPRLAPMTAQQQIREAAAANRQQFFNQNHGRPLIAAAPRPLAADRVVAPVQGRGGFDARPTGQMLPAQLPGGARQGQAELRPGQAGVPSQTRPGMEQGRRMEQGRGMEQGRVPQIGSQGGSMPSR